MVLSLCATTMVVRPVLALSSAAWTTFSLPVSRADVASSSSRIFGFLGQEISLVKAQEKGPHFLILCGI